MLMTLTQAALAATLVCAGGAQMLTLSLDGRTDTVILLASDAIPVVRTAARELQEHLQAATGARFVIREEGEAPPEAPAIVVGPGERFRAACPDVDLQALGHDGIVMRTVGDTLYLAGGPPRGTLYAVYTFLEEVVGCRWWSSREGEVFVPQRPTLEIPALDTVWVPRLRYREAFYRDALHGVHAARLKCNGHFARIPPDYGGHYTLLGWCHTFYQLLPPERYFADHPEWFSEIDGRRTADHAQLCLTNDAMRAELTRNALAWIRENPQAGIISISQNDWHGACSCRECRAIVEREGSEAGPLITFVNQVAEAIAAEFPGFLVETLAYQYTRQAPRTVRPRDNVIVRLCTIECSFAQPLATGPQNHDFRRDIEAWSAIAPQLYIWDYTTVFSNYIQPHPNLRVLAPNLRTFVEHRAIGLFEQGDAGSSCSDFPELRAWLLAHLMWDPARNPEALIDEFLRGYYGPAAEPLRAYIDLIHDAVEQAGTYLGCFLSDTSDWLDLQTMNRATGLFDAAERAVAGDRARLERVRRARMPLDHTWILRHASLRRQARLEGQPFQGPENLEALVADFIERAHRFQVGQWREGRPFEEYEPTLRARGRTAPPPQACQGLDPDDWVDFQEGDFSLHGLGNWVTLVEDPAASNQLAARMPGVHTQWAVQCRVPAEMAGRGRWRIRIVARCDARVGEGDAFQIGLYDGPARRGVVQQAVRIEEAGAGGYHALDLGIHALSEGMYVWIAPLGQADEVAAVLVDRVFWVREE